VHSPYVSSYEGVNLTSNLDEALKDMDCIAVAIRHREYLNIELDWLKNTLATPVKVDGRNVFDPTQVIDAGFTFRGVGTGLREPTTFL
jgi:UDP-N-acetyl-D-mannosaminuronate dehydrogenase